MQLTTRPNFTPNAANFHKAFRHSADACRSFFKDWEVEEDELTAAPATKAPVKKVAEKAVPAPKKNGNGKPAPQRTKIDAKPTSKAKLVKQMRAVVKRVEAKAKADKAGTPKRKVAR
jgi:hypothetical protein